MNLNIFEKCNEHIDKKEEIVYCQRQKVQNYI